MNLLVSNDDGIFAQGIRTLANTLAKAGHKVNVVCPDRERSATGHGLTLHKPIRAEEIDSVFDPRVKAWACSGTPSDCVKLALAALLPEKPDYVLSGINHGANLGTDILYSGTVSAAMEGLIEKIPAIAFSLTSYTMKDFSVAANFAESLVTALKQNEPFPPLLLNVNIPPIKAEAITGVAITCQGTRRYEEMFEKRIDPRGKTYYWLAGELTEDVLDPPSQSSSASPLLTDVQAIRKNYITITPLHYNLTCSSGLENLNHQRLHLPYPVFGTANDLD
ncbi:5'/3'-nucleotidase SurE [Roseofilum sp. Belize Diploria]|uniref:5'/3'-nucleotidase SurE n=1 Tax=Roseofilum sp. Belize Diploria TaxID=2821501 RepID=UPI000E7F4D86|nr:5'/3'-nucleotidase SurE [Roseofilum sp. Belize Diploria]MBP0009261.1 5'/3'-nucleotidase SurE [Roseofilum sp. Belize Diploria]HBQ99196.1 5'/3'-nucleotidase SurE [Cyanobacteria bacterium UBA11691]